MPRRKGSPEPPDIDNLPPGTPCWIYARDSGGEKQGKSVPDQIVEMEQEAQKRGWIIVDRFLDKKRKGGDAGRVEFNRLLARLKERPVVVPVLLNWDIRRLARDEGLGYELLAHTYQAGAAIHSVSYPLPSAARRYVEPFLIVSSADESRSKGKDVKRGLDDMAKHDFAPGGNPPFGYRVQYEDYPTDREVRRWPRWVKDEATEAVATRRWEMRLVGASYRQIAKATGFEHRPARLNEFFGNPAYCGFPTWHLNYQERDILDCIDLPPVIPPYVTVREWLQCRQPRGEHPRVTGSSYPLSHLGDCACGAPIEVHSDGRNRRCLACGASWQHGGEMCPSCGADEEARSLGSYSYVCTDVKGHKCTASRWVGGLMLEKAIIKALTPHFTAKHIVGAIAEANAALDVTYQVHNAARSTLLAQIAALQDELGNLAQAVARTGHSETLLALIQEKEAQVRQLRTELALVPERNSARSLDPADADALVTLFREKTRQMNKRDLRQLFQGVGLQFTLYRDRAECSVDWPPAFMFAAYVSSPRGIRTPDLSLERAAS